MTPKKKKCIVLFVPGAKWNQKDRKEWNWNWNGSSFYSSPSCDKKTLLSRTKDKNSFRFSSSLLSCSLLLTLSVRNLHHQIPFLFFFLQELFFLYSPLLFYFHFSLSSLSLSLCFFLSPCFFHFPILNYHFPRLSFLNYYLFLKWENLKTSQSYSTL